MLNKSEIASLMRCSAGIISDEDLSIELGYRMNSFEFIELLEKIYESDNQAFFEAFFWCMPNSLTAMELESIYSKYILLKNHHEHENITLQFQMEFNSNIKNIQVLLAAIVTLPVYLSTEDFKYPYIRKIIYAIGAQPEPYNIEALDKLAKQTNDEHIKQLALHQIEKRKRLGRWEFERNSKNAEL